MKTSAVALFALTRSPFYSFLQHFSGRCLQKHVFGNISVGVNFEEAGSCQQSRSALYFPSTFREVLFSGRSHVIICIAHLVADRSDNSSLNLNFKSHSNCDVRLLWTRAPLKGGLSVITCDTACIILVCFDFTLEARRKTFFCICFLCS